MELSVNTNICTCTTNANAYTIRPCLSVNCGCAREVGGIGTSTCSPPSQTFQVICTP
jgi:hypothetical protein